MNSQKREICPRRPRFSLTPTGSHRTHLRYYLFLPCSLSFFLSPVLPFSPPSPLPSPQALNILPSINMNPWLLLQTRELKRAFSQGSHTHRFSAFWLRSSVRLSQLHPKNKHRPSHRACTGPSTSAHVFPLPPDEIHSCRTRTYAPLALSPDSSE